MRNTRNTTPNSIKISQRTPNEADVLKKNFKTNKITTPPIRATRSMPKIPETVPRETKNSIIFKNMNPKDSVARAIRPTINSIKTMNGFIIQYLFAN